jgi:hypothetical protein
MEQRAVMGQVFVLGSKSKKANYYVRNDDGALGPINLVHKTRRYCDAGIFSISLHLFQHEALY